MRLNQFGLLNLVQGKLNQHARMIPSLRFFSNGFLRLSQFGLLSLFQGN